MNKALSKHIWTIDDCVAPVKSAPVKSSEKDRQSKRGREKGQNSNHEPELNVKRQKGAGSGFLSSFPLSEALVKFIGTGEIALSWANVIRRMCQYIKQNNLQDPSDKRRNICDDKLKELFDVDAFHGFTVSKLLATHFIKA